MTIWEQHRLVLGTLIMTVRRGMTRLPGGSTFDRIFARCARSCYSSGVEYRVIDKEGWAAVLGTVLGHAWSLV